MDYSPPPPFLSTDKIIFISRIPGGRQNTNKYYHKHQRSNSILVWCFLHSYRANLPLEYIHSWGQQQFCPSTVNILNLNIHKKTKTTLCSRRERIRYPFSLQIFLFYYFFLVILSRRCRFAISNCFYISLNVRSLHVFSFLRGASSAFDGQAQPICCQCSETPLISEPKSSQRCGGSSTQANYLGAASTRIQTPQRNEGRHCQS
jgi:hypothetical protein